MIQYLPTARGGESAYLSLQRGGLCPLGSDYLGGSLSGVDSPLATAVVGTYPTGMYSCSYFFRCERKGIGMSDNIKVAIRVRPLIQRWLHITIFTI